MNDDATNDDRAFGHDTLKLRCVFVPEGSQDQVSRADIAGVLGFDAVRIPAVFVPDGHTGPLTGYPYLWFGRMTMRRPADGRTNRPKSLRPGGEPEDGSRAMSGQDGTGRARPPARDAETGRRAAAPSGPATSFAPCGQPAGPGLPPVPVLARGQVDPIPIAVAMWRGLKDPSTGQAMVSLARSTSRPFGKPRQDPDLPQGAVQQVRSGETPVGSDPLGAKGSPTAGNTAAGANTRPVPRASPFTPDGSMPDMTPVPLLDAEGKPVLNSKDEPIMRPAGIDPQFFIDRGQRFDPDAPLGKMTEDLAKFRHGREWDVQRLGRWHEEFVDYSTIAIGLYGAAAGIPEKLVLRAEDIYAWPFSDFGKAKKDDTYTHLPKRNVTNTQTGCELYRTYTAKPISGKQ